MNVEKTHLITGAAGFIGSHLADRLLAQGFRVVGVDNMVLGRRENLARASENLNFRFEEVDVNDAERSLTFLRGQTKRGSIDTVWHLAANSDIQAGGRDPDVDLRLTFMTTYNVLKIMREIGATRLVFASSSAIYGEHDGPLREESGPLFPISNYGAMKLASEGIISAALEQSLQHAWIFRFPNVVGGRATHGAIYDFIKKLRNNPAELEVLGDGTQQKPYLHVSELIDAMLWAFERSTNRLNFFNIAPASGSSTVRFIAEAVVRAAAPEAKIRYTGGSRGWVGDVPRFSYSIEKIQRLGWTPKMNSDQAVELAIRENLGGEQQSNKGRKLKKGKPRMDTDFTEVNEGNEERKIKIKSKIMIKRARKK
jgi:UDP-glucose 4-epimerase